MDSSTQELDSLRVAATVRTKGGQKVAVSEVRQMVMQRKKRKLVEVVELD